MQQFSIYQTSEEQLLKAVLLLIEKCYYSNLKSVVLAEDQEQQEILNKNLWTYSRKQFIPHGSKLDPLPEKQPVYITDEMQNPNLASALIIISLANLEKILHAKTYIRDFKRVIIINNTPSDLEKLTLRISEVITVEKIIDCFSQNSNGSWHKL